MLNFKKILSKWKLQNNIIVIKKLGKEFVNPESKVTRK